METYRNITIFILSIIEGEKFGKSNEVYAAFPHEKRSAIHEITYAFSHEIGVAHKYEGEEAKNNMDWPGGRLLPYIQDRRRRLQIFNYFLEYLGLRSLPKLGDYRRGEIELLKIAGMTRKYDRDGHSIEILFEILPPSSASEDESFFIHRDPLEQRSDQLRDHRRYYPIKFNVEGSTNGWTAAYCFINGKVAIIKQWLPPACAWTYEIPRSSGCRVPIQFSAQNEANITFDHLPLAILVKVLGDDISEFLEIKKVILLDKTLLNPKIDSTPVTNLWVEMKIDKDELSRRMKKIGRFAQYQLQLWDMLQVEEALGSRIVDIPSVSVYALAAKHFRNNKQAVLVS